MSANTAETATGATAREAFISTETMRGVSLNPSILSVDEDPDSLEMLSLLLTSKGFDVVTSVSAAVAIERIRLRLPALLIVDPTMEGGAGLQICKQLRAHQETRHIPIILHTAVSPPAEQGIGDWVCVKPVKPSALMHAVRSVLKGRRP